MPSAQNIKESTEKHSVRNYDRLPLVAVKAKGVWVWDADGNKYMDMLCTYGANSLGHHHPRIDQALIDYVRNGFVTSMSGGFYTPPYADLVEALAKFCGFDKVILKTGGSEAFEAALKISKRWGYWVKQIPEKQNAEIIACSGNFHGRLPNAIGLSTEPKYKKGFAPFPAGLKTIPFGDPDALGRAIRSNTAAFVVEVIQGEGGINILPDGCLKEYAKICRKYKVLLIFDEIQTGLGRTGHNFAFEHEGVKPDILILAKTLGGGLMPISAVLANNEVMELIGPGDEGSTFGSHPLSCVVAREVLEVLKDEHLAERAWGTGNYFKSRLVSMKSPLVKEVRGRGLMIGVELVAGAEKAKYYCNKLLEQGIICEKARDSVVRFSPPLNITREEINWAMEKIQRVFLKI